ncbi:MAG: hypothetical protein M3Q81_03430 [bacterium]|nr:hypothetical protein [bacterium]
MTSLVVRSLLVVLLCVFSFGMSWRVLEVAVTESEISIADLLRYNLPSILLYTAPAVLAVYVFLHVLGIIKLPRLE